MLTYSCAASRIFRFSALGALGGLLLGTPQFATSQDSAPIVNNAKPGAVARLGYHFKVGDTTRYRVVGFFDGRIPPLVQAGAEPVHLRVTLEYLVRPEKLTADGAEVSFHVEKAEMLLLQTPVSPDNKMPSAADPIDLSVPLQQIQSALDVKATLKSDGTVVKVVGGDANSQKINLGIELRKLFLLLLPVAFPDNSVKIGDQWNFSDGLLGKNAGKTTYTARLTAFQTKKSDTVFQCSESASAIFDERLDKAGHAVAAAADAVDTSQGNASLTGDFSFTAPTRPDQKTNRSAGRLQEGHFILTAVLDRKRTLPDPGNPDAPLDTHVDLSARLTVQPIQKK